jgi:hypothetical protein
MAHGQAWPLDNGDQPARYNLSERVHADLARASRATDSTTPLTANSGLLAFRVEGSSEFNAEAYGQRDAKALSDALRHGIDVRNGGLLPQLSTAAARRTRPLEVDGTVSRRPTKRLGVIISACVRRGIPGRRQ